MRIPPKKLNMIQTMFHEIAEIANRSDPMNARKLDIAVIPFRTAWS